jgi:cytochrome c oxidase subunit 3
MSAQVQVSSPFQTVEQQRTANLLGMYVFLASEVMLFGGLFMVAFICRLLHPQEIVAASKHLHLWIGAANTAILLTSSFFIAAAVTAGREEKRRLAATFLICACLLGLSFLGVKAIEYRLEYMDGILPGFGTAHFSTPSAHLFMNIYLISTTLHAFHLLIGISLISGLATCLLRRNGTFGKNPMTLEILGLYWHLVDVIWIFLYPLLYLVR